MAGPATWPLSAPGTAPPASPPRAAPARSSAPPNCARAPARASRLSALAGSGAWTSLGPAPIRGSFYGGTASGRVDAIVVAPNGEIFIGSAGGGVWSSTDGGAHWVTHTDQVSSGLAIGALAVDPTDPQVIYAGTGEGESCGDCFYGGGVLKSTDGGATWTVINPGGMFTGVDFTGLVVDPSAPQRLYASTSSGLYESSDGGASWAQPSTGTGDFSDAASAVVLDPAHPATVYLATPGVGIQESSDGGLNFDTLAGGLPAPATFGVTALAIGTPSSSYPNADQTLYAAVALNGATDPNNQGELSMYKSTDGGASWNPVTSIPAYTNQSYAFGTGSADQASYDNTLAVSPADPSEVIAGGIAAIESTDGGTSWSNINGQNFFGPNANVMHPDFHAAAFNHAGSSVLLGSDGGVFGYAPTTGPNGVTNLNARPRHLPGLPGHRRLGHGRRDPGWVAGHGQRALQRLTDVDRRGLGRRGLQRHQPPERQRADRRNRRPAQPHHERLDRGLERHHAPRRARFGDQFRAPDDPRAQRRRARLADRLLRWGGLVGDRQPDRGRSHVDPADQRRHWSVGDRLGAV